MSTFLPNSQNFSINGGQFSHVGRDQHNHYNNASASSADGQMDITQGTSSMTMMVHVSGDQINHIVQQEVKEHTVFDDFRNIKRGDFCRLRDIDAIQYPRVCQCNKFTDLPVREGWKCEACCYWSKADRIFCLAEVDGSRPGQVYTAVSYSGPDARIAFEKDFRRCTGVLNSRVAQVYAIDIGTVPSLLLRNELVPYAHFVKNLDLLGLWFVGGLQMNWHCSPKELWIDSARGIICHGPVGPHTWQGGMASVLTTPSTVDLLQGDVFLRFFASQKSKEVDQLFINNLIKFSRGTAVTEVPGLVTPNTMRLFSALNHAPIAITPIAATHLQAGPPQLDYGPLARDLFFYRPTLLDQTPLENGLMRSRFRFNEDKRLQRTRIKVGEDDRCAWMLQAWSIFHALGITLERDLQRLDACLKGSLSGSRTKRQRRLRQPIYIFVHPPPSGLPFDDKGWIKWRTPSHWSFREDGGSPLSPKTCRYFGLPTTLHVICRIVSTSWRKDVYRIIHRYQQLRGFDPTTTDFARHLGYHHTVFLPAHDYIRFNELHEEQSAGSPDLHVHPYYPEDNYGSDDYYLAALFHANSDDDTYTNLECISSIQAREDYYEDLLASSDIRIQDLAVHMTNRPQEFLVEPRRVSRNRSIYLIMKIVHGADKQQTAGAGPGEEFEGIERSEQHMNQVLECTTLFPLSAEHSSLPSTSDVDLSSDDTSLDVIIPTPSQPTRRPATSHSETHKDGGAHPTSTYIDPSTYPVGSDTTISINDTPQNTGRSATLQSTNSQGHYDDLASNTGPAASYPPASAIQAFAYSANMVDPTNRDVSLTHHRNGGPPASAFQQRWVPRSFVPNVSCVTRPASGLVPTSSSSGSQSRSPIENAGDRGGNDDLD
ncbi:hypothetical protein PQX77_018940 [Marasmius sp. AFHP31]|nr:hypothetical protein PQX77_018940 [Marasmius sp. AFHP31]